jgi:hypothetical protein
MLQGAIAVREVAAGTRVRVWFVTLFALGFSIGLLMVFNSQLSGDQLPMLGLGWELAHNHVWIPHGMLTSAGGYSPGGLIGLLTGAQVMIWNDYRSPALFILIFNGGAFLFLMRALKPALTDFGQFLLLPLVWLSPWHLYFSSHVWDPNYMFVFAVLHLVTAQRMAKESDPWSTAAHVLILGLGLQIHTSAAVLCIASFLLYWTRLIRVNWTGFALGVLLCFASLVPWLLAVSHHPDLMPGGKGFPLRGLLYVFPLARGILYWLKMSSLSFAGRMEDFDFAPALGVDLDAALRPLALSLGVLAQASLMAALWLQWRFFRRRCLQPFLSKREPATPRAWLRLYIVVFGAAALIAFALSPTTIMFWQVLVALPVSALATILSAEALARTRLAPRVHQFARIWGVAAVLLLLCESVASPMYRCGAYRLPEPNAILEDLHVRMQCFR